VAGEVVLIDWPAALRRAAAAVERPEAELAATHAELEGAPAFRNRDFPLSPVPLYVRHEAALGVQADLVGYARLLGRIVRLYRDEPAVRAYYGLDEAARRLILADIRLDDAPWVCRLDGYVVDDTGRLSILENNADAPAGTLFSARINEIVARIGDRVGATAPLSSLTYGRRLPFLDALRRLYARVCGGEPGAIAVLQPDGAPNRESVEMVDELRAAGVEAFLADPRQVTVDGGVARFAGRRADLCWNKVNTVSWRAMTSDVDVVHRWEHAVGDSSLVHVNPFGARYVAESKLSLALCQEPEFADAFTAEERALVARLLPWARKVTAGALGPDGDRALVDELLERPDAYVIKEPYDIRGDGVTIGYDSSRSDWESAVARSIHSGGIAQRRIRPTHYPVVEAGSRDVAAMPVSLDTYLIGGTLAGFGSKASRNAKVNIFQGGQKLAVHVVGEDAS
jgi:hypothetical protein